MIHNYDSLFAAFMGVLTLIPASYVFVLQMREWLEPPDSYTRLKFILLIINAIFIVTLTPVVVYSAMRALGIELPLFRRVVTYIGRIGPFALSIGWVLVYRYKVED